MRLEEYLQDLAQRLRWRHVPEASVTDALREVASQTSQSGADPLDAFGPVDEYASNFERGRSYSPGFVTATGGAVLATLAVVGYTISVMAGLVPSSLSRSLVIYISGLVVLVVVVLVGARIDRRLPRGLLT